MASSEDSPYKNTRKPKLKEIVFNLSNEELIRRLKSSFHELQKYDEGENEGFRELSATLANSFLLNHRDKDVRLYSACCLLEIFRVFVPHPPWDEDQMKDIFRLIVYELKGLENVKAITYERHFGLLESLATVRTFAIAAEMEDAHDICVDLVKLFLSIIGEQHNTRVKGHMLEVVTMVILHLDCIPQEMLDAILINLVEPRRSKRPDAYKLACDVLDKCAAQIEPCIQLFFNKTLILGNPSGSELDGHEFELILELYKVNKSLLLSVIPQLEFKLKGNNPSDRLEAVKLLGKMFAHETTDLAEDNKALWSCYLGRFLDVSPDVRVECVQLAKRFLLSPAAGVRVGVEEQLIQRCLDPDDKVRLETVITICEAGAENFSLISSKLMDALRERMRDKKWLIRREVITRVGTLYKKVMTMSDLGKDDIRKIAWAPDKILHLYFQNSLDDRLCIERVVHGCLIPVTLDTDSRMKRLLNVYSSLDDASISVFDGMLKYRALMTSDTKALLDAFLTEENTEKEQLLHSKVQAVARGLPEQAKSQENLRKLLLMCADTQFYKLLYTCVDVSQECPKVVKAVTEVVKKVTIKNPIIETVKALLDRACPMLIDAVGVVVLLKEIKRLINGLPNEDEDAEDTPHENLLAKGKKGLLLVKALSACVPEIFQTPQCYEALLYFFQNKDLDIVGTTLKALWHVIDELEVVDKNLASSYHSMLAKLVTNGNCKHVKYALRCLHKITKDSSKTMDRTCQTLVDYLSLDDPRLPSAMVALAELAILSPDVFEIRQKAIIRDFVVKEILVKDRDCAPGSQDSNDEWCADHGVSDDTMLKIKGVKLLTNWLLGLTNRHSECSQPVLRLFDTILKHDGDLNNKGIISPPNRSRLRLAVACAMLRLMQNVNYFEVVSLEQFQQLALTMQDSCFEVRERFTMKLHRALDALKLPLDFYALFVLTAVDPSKERRNKVKQMISRNAQTRRDYCKQHQEVANRQFAVLPEYVLPYIVHLLAHHPDFDRKDMRSLAQFKEYVWFFLEPLMGTKADNYSFLKKLLENIKMTKDAQDPDNPDANENMYAVCDLAIGCIMNKTHVFTLKDFPGSLVLPKKLFTKASGSDVRNSKSYLPKNFVFTPKKQKPAPLDLRPATAKTLVKDREKTKKSSAAEDVHTVEEASSTKKPRPATKGPSGKTKSEINLSAKLKSPTTGKLRAASSKHARKAGIPRSKPVTVSETKGTKRGKQPRESESSSEVDSEKDADSVYSDLSSPAKTNASRAKESAKTRSTSKTLSEHKPASSSAGEKSSSRDGVGSTSKKQATLDSFLSESRKQYPKRAPEGSRSKSRNKSEAAEISDPVADERDSESGAPEEKRGKGQPLRPEDRLCPASSKNFSGTSPEDHLACSDGGSADSSDEVNSSSSIVGSPPAKKRSNVKMSALKRGGAPAEDLSTGGDSDDEDAPLSSIASPMKLANGKGEVIATKAHTKATVPHEEKPKLEIRRKVRSRR